MPERDEAEGEIPRLIQTERKVSLPLDQDMNLSASPAPLVNLVVALFA
jgi:hypothetical protein